jgi:hypothetical protein
VRQRGDLIQTFKILKGIENVDLNAPVRLAPSVASSGPAESLRGHKMRIEMEVVENCDQRKHFLLNRVANAWNKLPGEVVHDPSVTSFKAKIEDQINETNTKRTSKIQVLVSNLFII